MSGFRSFVILFFGCFGPFLTTPEFGPFRRYFGIKMDHLSDFGPFLGRPLVTLGHVWIILSSYRGRFATFWVVSLRLPPCPEISRGYSECFCVLSLVSGRLFSCLCFAIIDILGMLTTHMGPRCDHFATILVLFWASWWDDLRPL